MRGASQITMSFPANPSFGRDDFLVSASNREALDWIDLWPKWNAPLLYIYGPAGSGKTHLAHIWQSRAGKDATLIEDVDRLIGNRPQEETLFHLYNRLRQISGSILVTGNAPLQLLKFAVPDLASRLRSCPQVALGLPDEDLLRAVLVKLFSDRQMRIDVGVIEYCLPRMERSFAAARELVAALDEKSLATKRPVTVSMARDILNPHQGSMFCDG